MLTATKSFGLNFVDGNCGKVHFVRENAEVKLPTEGDARKLVIESLRDSNDEWTNEIFNINRFCRNQGELFEISADLLVD